MHTVDDKAVRRYDLQLHPDTWMNQTETLLVKEVSQ